MSPTWRDEAEQRGSSVALSRLSKRAPSSASFLVLPAVVVGILCSAFLIWFLMGAPEFAVSPWQDSPAAPVRVAVQAPQMANAPPLAPLRASSPPPMAQEPVAAAAPEVRAQAPVLPSEASMALALQPTPQITTPAAMRSVISEPQQISAPEQDLRTPVAPQPARRATPTPTPPAASPMQQAQPVAAAMQPAKPQTPAAAPTPADPAQTAAEAEPSGRRNFSIVLARVETESEARAKLGPLKQKFGALLGGRRLSYHRVKEDGVYIWRVRSMGLTETDASELCDKIEGAGGDCTADSQ